MSLLNAFHYLSESWSEIKKNACFLGPRFGFGINFDHVIRGRLPFAYFQFQEYDVIRI